MATKSNTAITWVLLPLVMGCAVAEPYVPNRPPVPLITHQGELIVSGGAHFPDASGYDYQVVYAPWDHLSTYAAFQFDRGYAYPYQSNSSTPGDYYHNHFFEIGLGYYDSIHWAHYEAYVLAGLGSGADRIINFRYFSDYSSSSAYTDTTTLSVFRLGIQQNIGIEGSAGAIGIGLGLGYERLYNLNRMATNYVLTQTPISSDSIITASSVHETAPQSAFYAEPLIFWQSPCLPVKFDAFQLFILKFLWEIWWPYRTNTYPAFGGLNESLTLSLDF